MTAPAPQASARSEARPAAPTLDTVEHAAAAQRGPAVRRAQPQAGRVQRIRDILGRRPTAAELATYSVMWSEHCSYKSSKVHLSKFGAATTDEMKKHLLVGIGENAGVVDIGDGWAVTFKVESHNHPSFVEPYQGAATGVGGIVRDIISMGARPVAVMDQLRFGAVDHPDTARVVHGVVSGVGGYGNSLGLPNIGGELVFDSSYQGNPLVNALCLGVLRHEDIHLANASGVGNKVVLFGAHTGSDGIGGASILASETFEDGVPAKRPSVQVGDPFMEKVLIECCLELYAAQVVEGIQDLGAPASRARRRSSPRTATAACTVARRRPAARPDAQRGRDPHVRVAGAHDGGRRAGEARRVPRHHRQVGRQDRRHRRGRRPGDYR